jgi:hypothetical protein
MMRLLSARVMNRIVFGAALVLSTIASAKSTSDGDPVTGEIFALDVHQAARFAATAYHGAVVVVGGGSEPLHIDLRGASLDAALARLAAASHMVLGRKDAVWILSPPALSGEIEGPRRSLPPGARVELDVTLIPADDLLATLAQALHLRPDGHVEGRLSVKGDHLPSLPFVGLVTRLGGHEASRHDKRLVVSGRLPDAPPTPPAPPCPRRVDPIVELDCVDPSTLEMVAWAARGDGRWAAVRVRPATAETPAPVVIVARGEGLGRGGATVTALDASGITLSNQTTIGPVPAGRDREERSQ